MKTPLLFILLLSLSCSAQKQGNIWYFGNETGLDFSSGSPVVIYGGKTNSDVPGGLQEGTASISDSAGHILFYSGGQTVWNSDNVPMPNGTGLMGGISSTQSSLIVPLPGSPTKYYLFTTDEFQNYVSFTGKGLRYSIIDMCEDNGKGDVTEIKNVLLMDSTSEKLSAVQDSQATGYWILGRKMFTDAFYAWHMTSNGITDTVISHVDTTTFINGWPQGQGQMKFSPDGTRLALVYGNVQPASLGIFDFNSATGAVSNQRQIQLDLASLGRGSYGIEFSPNSTKVYVTSSGGYGPYRIYQYDVTAGGGTAAAIDSSKYVVYIAPVNATSILYGLQLAPDGKIYVVANDYSSISAIASPDMAGAGAIFQYHVLQFTTINNYTFPSFIAGYKYHNPFFHGILPSCITVNGFETLAENKAAIYPNPNSDKYFELEAGAALMGNRYTIVDAAGRVISSSFIEQPKSRIELNAAPGVYFLCIQTNHGLISKKLIKI